MVQSILTRAVTENLSWRLYWVEVTLHSLLCYDTIKRVIITMKIRVNS